MRGPPPGTSSTVSRRAELSAALLAPTPPEHNSLTEHLGHGDDSTTVDDDHHHLEVEAAYDAWWDSDAGGTVFESAEPSSSSLGSDSVQGLVADLPNRHASRILVWKALGADPEVIAWLEKGGYPIEWDTVDRPGPRKGSNNVGAKGSPQYEFTSLAVAELVKSGAAERGEVVHEADLSVVDKKGGKFRLIWDGRICNKFVRKKTFRMATLNTNRERLRSGDRGDMAFSIDLSSAYHHCKVREEDRKYLGFRWEGVSYRYCCLPFGGTFAPLAYTRMGRVASRFWSRGCRLNPSVMATMDNSRDPSVRALAVSLRRQLAWARGSIGNIQYIDDHLVYIRRRATAAASAQVFRECQRVCLNTLLLLGWVINWKKSELRPSRDIVFLGTRVDFVTGRFRVPEERRVAILAEVRAARRRWSSNPECHTTDLASLTGRLLSLRLAIGVAASFCTRAMFRAIACRPHAAGCRGGMTCGRRCWQGQVHITDEILRDLDWWAELLVTAPAGMPFSAYAPTDCLDITSDMAMATDASAYAAGGIVDGQAREIFVPFTPEQCAEGSMVRELNAIEMCLLALAPTQAAPGTEIALRTDSLCSHQVLQNGGSGHPEGDEIALRIYLLCSRRAWRLRTTWVPRAQNQEADDASKLVDSHAYSVSQARLDALCDDWGTPTMDLMAAEWSRITPRGRSIPFCSRYACEGSSGDAFDVPWATPATSDLLWIFPPPFLLHRVLRRCAAAGSRAIVIVPDHSQAPWFSWVTSSPRICTRTAAPWITAIGPLLSPRDLVPAKCTARAGARPVPATTSFLPLLLDFSAHRTVDGWF